jgi:hypothetical protein
VLEQLELELAELEEDGPKTEPVISRSIHDHGELHDGRDWADVYVALKAVPGGFIYRARVSVIFGIQVTALPAGFVSRSGQRS